MPSVTHNDTISPTVVIVSVTIVIVLFGVDEGDYGRRYTGGVNILNLPSFTWPTQLSRFTQLSQSRTATVSTHHSGVRINEIHEQRPAG